MGWLSIICAVIGAWLFHLSQDNWLFWLTTGAGMVAAWSYGIMHNYAMEAARRRPGFTGRFYDINEREADAAPNWLAATNMIASIICYVLVIVGVVVNVVVGR